MDGVGSSPSIRLDVSRSQSLPPFPTELEVHSATSRLRPHESLALTREERVRRRFAIHDASWRTFQSRVSSKLGRDASASLGAAAAQFRSRREEIELLDAVRARDPLSGADLWAAGLRGGGPQLVQVGNAFTGLWCPLPSSAEKLARAKRVPVVRAPTGLRSAGNTRSASASGARDVSPGEGVEAAGEGGAEGRDDAPADSDLIGGVRVRRRCLSVITDWRTDPAHRAARAEYGAALGAIRRHEITDKSAEFLVIRGVPLFSWASGALDSDSNPRAPGSSSVEGRGGGGAADFDADSMDGGDGGGSLLICPPARSVDAARAALIARGVWRVDATAMRSGGGGASGSGGGVLGASFSPDGGPSVSAPSL